MPFTHHSHSGDFCNHAIDTLEAVVQRAIQVGMTSMALTEHIPRGDEDLYPGEKDHAHYITGMYKIFDNYYNEATALRKKYASQIQILIGFEIEWIRPESLTIIEGLLESYRFDLFIGSVHHVHTFPIDFDAETFEQARRKAGGSDEGLYADYYDAQYEMLQALKPPIVGHFDLIRLKAADPDTDWKSMPKVWAKIMRNLEAVKGYGGILELNASALRKGLKQPYPREEICSAFMKMGGRFTLSDDSHGVEQVGTNYGRCLEFVERIGLERICWLEPGEIVGEEGENRLDSTIVRETSVAELRGHGFWKGLKSSI